MVLLLHVGQFGVLVASRQLRDALQAASHRDQLSGMSFLLSSFFTAWYRFYFRQTALSDLGYVGLSGISFGPHQLAFHHDADKASRWIGNMMLESPHLAPSQRMAEIRDTPINAFRENMQVYVHKDVMGFVSRKHHALRQKG